MKKLLFSILAIGMSLTGCTDWDDAVTESYGAGPEISVSVAATADDSFSFTLSPASGTNFYSYVVKEGAEAAELDGYSLLKQQYAGVDAGLLNATDNATATIEVAASPNTSYVIYAVAANDKGIVGNVATQVVKTTDAGIPYPTGMATDGDAVAAQVAFSENIVRGEGAVTAQYFVEWTGEFVDVAAEDITVTVSGNAATFVFANVPASATVLVSWAEDAFMDYAGNGCQAFTSGLNDEGTDFAGVYFNVTDVPFDITAENATSPAEGESFQDWTAPIVFTFDMDVYKNDALLEGGEVKVMYSHEGKVSTIEVPNNYWGVNGSNLIVYLPEEPVYGDWVGISIAEGTIYDVYGNPNNAVTLENVWLYSYGYTRDMVLGNYTVSYYSYKQYANGSWVVSTEEIKIEADPETEDGIIMTGFYGTDAPVYATFNGDYATITMQEQMITTTTLSSGTEVIVTIGGNTDDGSLVFTVNGDGSFGYYDGLGFFYWVYEASSGSYMGYFEGSVYPEFTKQVEARSLGFKSSVEKTKNNFTIVKAGSKLVK